MTATSGVLSPPAEQLTLSLIVPARATSDIARQNLRRCLLSIERLLPPADEVLIVLDGDDSENFQTRQIAEGHGARVLALPQVGGPGAARNLGARESISELLYFVDADCEVATDNIARIKTTFAEDAKLDAIIGSYDDAPGAANFLSQYKNLMHHWTHQTSGASASTFWGACGAMRRSTFLELGGFDTQKYQRPCIEDIELGYRLKRAGGEIRLVKGLQVKHLKEYSAASLLKSDFFDRAIPWTQLLLQQKQHGNLNFDLNLDTTNRLSVLLVYSLLFFVAVAPRFRLARGVAVLCATALLILNWRTYRFLARTRGIGFALRAVPWHWLYFAYGGLGFVVGATKTMMDSRTTSMDESITENS